MDETEEIKLPYDHDHDDRNGPMIHLNVVITINGKLFEMCKLLSLGFEQQGNCQI
jgi:hypothetical protein